jgi:MYXO-CTERM domain-containing protein
VGGHGGAALGGYEPRERLLLGGGGGAGIEGTDGGAGGGIIFFRARELQGPKPRGLITANGTTPLAATHGGGGGGGAGGTVHVRISERFGCTVLEARGGTGANSDISPGGGGGGGRLFAQGAGGVESVCALSVNGGLAGSTPTAGHRGAEPVTAGDPVFAGGQTIITQGFVVPTVTWVSPGAGAVDVNPSPLLEGKTAPGSTVQVFLDGVALGSPVVADDAGGFTIEVIPALPKGPHEARAWAEQLGVRGALSEPLGFTVGDPLSLRVGFGCGAVPVATGSGLGALGLVVLAVLLGRQRR